MATIFDNSGVKPAIHALIIGVGDYWHMTGGKEPKGLSADMEVLTSPQKSAAAFAKWAVDELKTATPALGSVELLLGDGSFEGQDCGPATLDAISEASLRWRDRCESDPGNIALFYFCGHGVRGVDDFLLAQDFGAKEMKFWENAFRFRGTYSAMASCKARTQLYFVDACRNIPRDWLKKGTDTSTPLFDPVADEDRPRDAQILYSTAANDFAQGTTDGVSPFTAELLNCLRKYGAKKTPKGPMVTTGSVINALQNIFNPPRDSGNGQRAMRDGESDGDTELYILQTPKALWRPNLPEPGVLTTQPTADPLEESNGKAWELEAFQKYLGSFTPHAPGNQYDAREFEAIPPVVTEEF